MQLDTFVEQYLITALWSTNDESDERGGEPLDKNYDLSDIAEETINKAIEDCKRFREENAEDLSIGEETHAAHDFWLTRNGHGAGFWDGDWPEPQASRLTAACKAFGEVDLYVGDDGKIYS